MISYRGRLYFADPAAVVIVLGVRIRISKAADHRLEEFALISQLRRKQDVRHALSLKVTVKYVTR